MHKRFLITALAVIMLVMPGQTATTEAKQHQLLTIQSPTKRQTCLQDTVEVVVELKNGADPSTFRAWLNSKEITDRFTLTGSTMTAVIDPDDGVRSYSETIETSRDDKGVWFIEGRRHKYRSKKARFNRLRAKVRGAKKRVDVAACTFEVNSSLYNTFEAMGYAIATDRLWQMELYRRTARGRLAEIFGESQLKSDVFMRTIGYSDDELSAGFADLDDESKAIIAGYAAGINRRIWQIYEDTTILPFEFEFLQLSELPLESVLTEWTVEDILAWCALLQREFDPEALDQAQLKNAALLEHLTAFSDEDVYQAMAMFKDLRWSNDPEAQTYIVDTKEAIENADDTDIVPKIVPGLGKACNEFAKRIDKIKENLKKINAKVKMGSYAWVVSGKKTASGNPIIYSGPQMGFSVPSIVCEGSIRAAGLNISGMTVPGIPGIIIGRTPHHAWSMQVGHAHTTDYTVGGSLDEGREETIKVINLKTYQMDKKTFNVFRTEYGPVIKTDPFISWRYAHWGYEFNVVKAFLGLARAESMNDFGTAIEEIAVSQHFCYADRDGNIAYWMSGRDPARKGMDDPKMRYLFFLPQDATEGEPVTDWVDNELVPRSHARNPKRDFFAGWNNKTSPTYFNAFNSNNDIYGPFQRAHVIYNYLTTNNDLTFEDIRDLALNIAATDSFNGGGNPWAFVANKFIQYAKDDKLDEDFPGVLEILEKWNNDDGHFVEGNWVNGDTRAQGWVLMNDWLKEIIHLTFDDELGDGEGGYLACNNTLLFNVILHAMNEDDDGIKTTYNWFSNSNQNAPQTLEAIVIRAFENVMATYGGSIPIDVPRGNIEYRHDLLNTYLEKINATPIEWTTPFASRSTYAHVVEFGRKGPIRIESMFPLGESGNITLEYGVPIFDDNFLSMKEIFDDFTPREFPLFTGEKGGKKR